MTETAGYASAKGQSWSELNKVDLAGVASARSVSVDPNSNAKNALNAPLDLRNGEKKLAPGDIPPNAALVDLGES